MDVENNIEFEQKTNHEKWGVLVANGGSRGFTLVPEVLLRHQGNLEITSNEMVVLLNLLAHWWFPTRKPFPGNDKLAQRTGLCKRSVQRAVSGMKKKGLIEVSVFRNPLSDGGYISRREVDFSPLKRRLGKLERVDQQ